MRYLNDLLGLAGIAMIGAGLWLYDPRVSLVVVGVILLAAAYRGATNAS